MATHVIRFKHGIDRASNFVLLVSYHNMAHIYSSRFCPEEMRGCFDATHFLLTQGPTQRFLDKEDMEFFSMTSLLEDKDIGLAPAAYKRSSQCPLTLKGLTLKGDNALVAGYSMWTTGRFLME